MTTRYTWADEQERRPPRARLRPPEVDPDVTFVDGRGFRRETSRHDPDNRITSDEQRLLNQRRREAAEARRAEAERGLDQLVRLGEALRALER